MFNKFITFTSTPQTLRNHTTTFNMSTNWRHLIITGSFSLLLSGSIIAQSFGGSYSPYHSTQLLPQKTAALSRKSKPSKTKQIPIKASPIKLEKKSIESKVIKKTKTVKTRKPFFSFFTTRKARMITINSKPSFSFQNNNQLLAQLDFSIKPGYIQIAIPFDSWNTTTVRARILDYKEQQLFFWYFDQRTTQIRLPIGHLNLGTYTLELMDADRKTLQPFNLNQRILQIEKQ